MTTEGRALATAWDEGYAAGLAASGATEEPPLSLVDEARITLAMWHANAEAEGPTPTDLMALTKDLIARLYAACRASGARPAEPEPTADDVPPVMACPECGDIVDLPDIAKRFVAFWARNRLGMAAKDARALAAEEDA